MVADVDKSVTQELWTSVDRYITELLVPPDPVLDAALERASAAGLPPINVAPNEGKLLWLLARIQGAQSILEVGTLGGYSTIWLARALHPGGRLVTLEIDKKHAQVARANFAYADLEQTIDLRVGPALDTLAQLAAERRRFDLMFIDADKPNIPNYFEWGLKLSHRGSMIIVDNVIRGGEVIDSRSRDPAVQGVRHFNELLAAEPRVSATAIQTVGSKGYDGFAIVLVTTTEV